MYRQLLKAVLAFEADLTTRSHSQNPLADVVRRRCDMERQTARADPQWAFQAVADQLAYDAALVRLAQNRGMTIGPDAFAIPERGRAEIEDALIASGVDLQTQAESGIKRRLTDQEPTGG